MSEKNDIKSAIKALTEKENSFFVCTVDYVDLDELTCYCIPSDGSADVLGVALIADPSKKGLICIPAVGSAVIISQKAKDSYYVAMFSQVDEIRLNGVNYGGLVKIDDLVTKLNNLESKVNSIISTFNSHVHPGVTVGGGATLVSATPVVGVLTPTQLAELENEKVKHGNGL